MVMGTRAKELLTDEQRKAVEAAVAEAETKTSGEIVVALATRSGRYDRAEDLFGLVLGCAAVAVGWTFLQGTSPRAGAWESGWGVALGLLPVLGLFVGGFALGAFAATRAPILSRLFLTKTMMLEEIRDRASEAFRRLGAHRTEGGTGILIYVSLFERMVWVVGDDAIDAKVGRPTWDEIRDRIVEGFRTGDVAAGLSAAVRRAGEVLAAHFPLREGDKNEVSNELRILD